MRFENTGQGARQLLNHITTYVGGARAVVEATANHWIRMYDGWLRYVYGGYLIAWILWSNVYWDENSIHNPE